jgi:hypothetical protein
LSSRLSASIWGDGSASVIVKWLFMKEALFPPPDPSSNTVRGRSFELSTIVRV